MSVLNQSLYHHIHLGPLSRWFPHAALKKNLKAYPLPGTFFAEPLGESYEKRPIECYTFGKGPIRILMWSQMHGNEPTGTHALLELFRLLGEEDFNHTAKKWEEALTLCIVPILNPDGAQAFTRQNAQGIDMNRDAVAQQSTEMQLFFKLVDSFKPHWAFNLHDQRNIFSCGNSGKPATLSFLAPSANEARTPTTEVKLSKQLISSLVKVLEPLQIGGMARFTDEYYSRALGEFFHRNKIPCVLMECGPAYNDPHRLKARKMNLMALVTALECLASNTLEEEPTAYERLPLNTQHNVDMLFRGSSINGEHGTYVSDLALLQQERLNKAGTALEVVYVLNEVGDLRQKYGLLEWSGKTIDVKESLVPGAEVSITVQGPAQKLRFEKGRLVEHLF